MGGGPSKEEKARQAALQQRDAEAAAAANQAIATASKPDPLVDRQRARDMAFMDWEEGKGLDGTSTPIDVTKAPTLGPALDIYNRAATRRAGDRQGIGALRMGIEGSNPEVASRIAELRDSRNQEQAAGDLENTVRMRSAEVNNSILPIAGFDQNRNMGIAGLRSGRSDNASSAYNSFLTRPRQPSFWQQMLSGGLSAASNFAGSTAGAGLIAGI